MNLYTYYMILKHQDLLLIIAFLFVPFLTVMAAEEEPEINPTAIVTNAKGETSEGTVHSGSAPLEAHFVPNATGVEGYSAHYEWIFYKQEASIEAPYLVRHEEETDFVFKESGGHYVSLKAYFVNGNDTIVRDSEPISISISTSKLDFPNAFSPNGDGMNDIYRAKREYESIVEFKAVIYNRWGQKLFEWTDPEEGWDGTFHGTPVKQGVYFMHCVAKGADGTKYNIRKDVNLLRTFDATVEK